LSCTFACSASSASKSASGRRNEAVAGRELDGMLAERVAAADAEREAPRRQRLDAARRGAVDVRIEMAGRGEAERCVAGSSRPKKNVIRIRFGAVLMTMSFSTSSTTRGDGSAPTCTSSAALAIAMTMPLVRPCPETSPNAMPISPLGCGRKSK
jgi:hypothetical protein